MKPRKILTLADLHVGSRWGLWLPKFRVQDPRTGDDIEWILNQTQKNLWAHWSKKMLPRIQDVECIIIIGDVIDGLAKNDRGRGLVTSDLGWQTQCATEIIRTLPEVPTYILEGTDYHELEDGRSVEQTIAESLPHATYGDELVIEECGIRIFARHVIGASTSTWQYMTTAPARDHMLLYLNKAEEKYGPIDVACFAHRHSFVAAEYPSGLAYVNPCWQTKTHYAVKKGIVSPPDIGWITLNIFDKKCIAIDRSGITHLQRPCRIVGRDVKKPGRVQK